MWGWTMTCISSLRWQLFLKWSPIKQFQCVGEGGGGFAIVLNDCLFGLNIEKTSTFGPGFRLGQSSVLHQLEGKIHIMDLQEKTVEKCRNSWTNHTEATESS